jgi:hypothetical protein
MLGTIPHIPGIPSEQMPEALPGSEATMRQPVRMAALAVSLVLALGAFSLAQDRDDYYRGNIAQTRQYGYDNGYRDGQRKGRENDAYDYRTPDWRQASHGYKSWMGPLNAFQNGYQQGYTDGFRSGFISERPGWRGDRDGDRDDGYRNNGYRGDGFYGSGSRNRVAYDSGYQDGVIMAREDQYKNKPFNPNPRARFGGRDDGYSRSYGDKNVYKAEYTDGYRAGYESAFNRRY